MRSRAVILPLACCFSTDFSDAAWAAASRRLSKSAIFPAVVLGSSSGAVLISGAALTARPPLPGRPGGSRSSRYLSHVDSPVSAQTDGPSRDPRAWDDAVLQGALDQAGDGGWGPVVVLGSTGSTNADAVDQVREGAPEGFTLVADEQTQGRGRLERTWVSPYGAGVAMSVVLRPVAPEASWGWIPLVAGIAVVTPSPSKVSTPP